MSKYIKIRIHIIVFFVYSRIPFYSGIQGNRRGMAGSRQFLAAVELGRIGWIVHGGWWLICQPHRSWLRNILDSTQSKNMSFLSLFTSLSHSVLLPFAPTRHISCQARVVEFARKTQRSSPFRVYLRWFEASGQGIVPHQSWNSG